AAIIFRARSRATDVGGRYTGDLAADTGLPSHKFQAVDLAGARLSLYGYLLDVGCLGSGPGLGVESMGQFCSHSVCGSLDFEGREFAADLRHSVYVDSCHQLRDGVEGSHCPSANRNCPPERTALKGTIASPSPAN